MPFTIRRGRPEDKAFIAAFTQNTFSWGDYVTDQFDHWMRDPRGLVVVASDDAGAAIAVSFTVMASPTEAWFQGARVRNDQRRRGIAGAMIEFGTEWARGRGALIARLAVEEANTAGHLQVKTSGFRATTRWVNASRPVGEGSPIPLGNGGLTVPAQEQLVPAASSEAVPAFMSWGAGPIARPSRGLFAVRWRWRRLTTNDLEQAGHHDALWTARSGWAMAALHRDQLEVSWIETRESDAVDLMRALVDLANKRDAESIGMTLPDVGWLTKAARHAGCDLRPITLYEISL